ncbi:tetratricopeptide repeat protein [Streptomyces sp. RB6PN25]|uniref:Tetratricopeptide repeat protein n=1 Tax=Streptomyces humicola TaxID=2953240 RepID=A0ABT1PN16_9ACTN|nr:helix-turn-helix domain-containing protein [Streptomyces humicola]MCQ4079061.1 tetratricopeptide repeat protein [Streptomyces humicola]
MDEGRAIGARVQKLRIQRKLTQRQLAEPKYTAAYVSTLEAGKVRPSETALRYLADRLGTSYEQLVTGIPAELRTELREGLAEARTLMSQGSEPHRVEGLLSRLLVRAEQYNLADLQADLHVALGDQRINQGELAEAREHFERAERLLGDEPLPRRVPALRGVARAHHLAGELRYACYRLESGIDELNGTGLPDPEALLLLYTAVITPYLDMGSFERAGKAAALALELAPQVRDPVAVAALHRSVARTLAAQGRFEDAETYLLRAQSVYQQWEIRADLAHCHWMRGYLHTQHGLLAEAEDELRAAGDMLRETGAELYAVQVEVELADVRWRRGRAADAEELLTALLGGLGPGHGAVHAAAAHRLLGMIREQHGDDEAAERHYQAAVLLQEEADVTGDLADTSRLLGDLLYRRGRTDEAVEAYRHGLTRLARPGTTTLGPSPATPPIATPPLSGGRSDRSSPDLNG